MRACVWISLAVAGIIGGSPAAAQSRSDLERCRAIEDDTRRLACYDSIELAIAQPRSKYQKVTLDDFKEDALTYRGDLVEVSGWVRPDGELLRLGLDAEDSRPIPIEYDSLPRRAREDFLAQCGEGCAATVQGRANPVNFTTGIVADALIPH